MRPMAVSLIRKTFISAFLAAILPLLLAAQITRVNLPQSFPVLQSGNQLWIGTPAGVYQYNQSDDSYKRFAPPNARPDLNIRFLYSYKEWLWCVMDSGLAALQTRLNDWLVFDTSNGLPSQIITGMDFQDDYVWISTPNGAARFDLLIEQWEQFDQKRGLPDLNIADIKSDGESIWMLTGSSLSEYSQQFEKWRTFKIGQDSANFVPRLFLFGDNLWIVTDHGLICFNPKLQKQQEFLLPYLAAENLIDIYLEGDKMWAVTRNGLYYYGQQSGVWTEFEGNVSLGGTNINYGLITQKQIWILTENTTMVWDRDLKTWQRLDYSTGLSLPSYNSVSSDGDLTFLFTPQIIEYRKTQQDPWRKFSIEASGFGGTGRNILGRMFDNPEGGSIYLGDYLWNWQGTRITYIQDYVSRMNGGTVTSQSSAWRLDVKSQIELGSGRRVAGFYNNMDYSETKYGARFRGNDSDYVREVMWGDFRREPGNVPFGQSAEIFGTNLWLQVGPKSERFKRSFVSAKATAGEVRSKKEYEKFKGAYTQFSGIIKDYNYVSNQFFTFPGADSIHTPENIEIFIDDSIAGNDNLRTLKGAVIAGVPGDFDPLVPSEEFYFYKRGNAIRILTPVFTNSIITARYWINGVPHEAVLQNGINSTSKKNFYFLGAQEILPYFFSLSIKDSLGKSVPLSYFGIDDGMGRVDAKWIDYDTGVLMFPEPLNLNSSYSIYAEGQTQRTLIQLGHRNLVRGSETLRLDDAAAEAGNDFVLDYTNGTLIFVREGIVNPDTRIEIEYEYYESTGNQLASASLNIAPSDKLYIQGDWQKLSEDSTHLVALHGELRQQAGEFDIRVIPGAIYQTAEQKITGTSAEALISSKWLRLQSRYERYDSSYQNIHRNRSAVGDVKNRIQFYGSVDVREDLRLTGEWKQTEGMPDPAVLSGSNPTDKTSNVSILYHGTGLPAAQVTYQSEEEQYSDSTESKKFLQGLFEYQVPKSWISSLSLQGLKTEYFIRYGWQNNKSGSVFSEQNFMQTYYKLNAMVTDQFQTGLFYRRNTIQDAASEASGNPVSSADKLLADIAFGEWRFFQINGRLENTLQKDYHRSSDSLTYYARQFYQINTRLSPGQLWSSLSSLFFEITYNQTASQSDLSSDADSPTVWRIAVPEYSGSGSYVLSRNFFLKNEFRPNADWLVSTLFEKTTQHIKTGTTGLDMNTWQFTERIDVRPGYMTHMIAQFRRVEQDQGFNRTNKISEPSLWVEQRWTQDFLSTAQIIYRCTDFDDRSTLASLDEWEGLLDLVLRKDDWLLMRHVELRQSFSGSRRQQDGIPLLNGYRFGATTSVDVYPVYSLIIRLRADWNRFVDELIESMAYSTMNLTLKVTLQL